MFSPGADRLFGYRASEILGRPLSIILPPEWRDSHSHKVDGQPVQVGATIGISLFPKHGTDAASLIARADRSLYFAKSAGKNTFHIL